MTDQQKAEIAALAAMPDAEIDTSDIPEIPTDWANAKRGVFYHLAKRRVTLDLDADVIAWFEADAKDGIGCQTHINQALREYVARQTAGVSP